MADPRYRRGAWRGNRPRRRPVRPAPALECPICHGWRLSHLEDNDLPVYRFAGRDGVAHMRQVVPADDLPDGWLVSLILLLPPESGPLQTRREAYHVTGELADITEDVKQMVGGSL